MAMDYFTKWPEVYAVPHQSIATSADRLVAKMFCWFGPLKSSTVTRG